MKEPSSRPVASKESRSPEPELVFDDVTVVFQASGSGRDVTAIESVNLDVAEHEVVCVIGPSGCGKSTILNLVAGFATPTSGRVLHRGRPVSAVGRDRMMVFQSPVLFPWMTVRDNVSLVGQAKEMDLERVEKRGDQMLAEVGLADFGDHYPYQLSGGMRQRLQLARALTAEPAILLLDEPFGALDAQTRFVMQEIVQDIVVRHAPTVIFITHDIEEALFLGDRVYLMSGRPGRVVDVLTMPWDHPRTVDTLTDTEFLRLKTQLLTHLRDAASAAPESQPTFDDVAVPTSTPPR